MSLALLIACSGSPPVAPPAAAKHPNVLLFTLDTLRADALPMYGNTSVATPNLAALAQRSTRFSRAFTVTPLTIVTHSSLFTGLYPPRHGVRDNGDFFLSDQALTLAEQLRGAGYATMASVGAEVTSHHWGFSQGFDVFNDDMGADAKGQNNRWRVERRGNLVVDDALKWLEQRPKDGQPWFAWVHLFDAHHPYEAPEPFASQYPEQPYLAEVAGVDAQVGRVLDWLAQSGQGDDTLVIAVADHGEGLGSHGEAMHGVLLYNATTRIPLIISPPGGQLVEDVIHFPVSIVDILPTILGVAGVAAPPGLDGIDLSPWLGGIEPLPASPVDRPVYIESLYAWRHYGWAPQRALVTEDLKLIDSTTPELYSRQDVFEASDLARDRMGVVGQMQAQTAALYATLAPQTDVASAAQSDPERLAQLEALGYVVGVTESSGDGFGQGLPDPVEKLPLLKEDEKVRSLLQRGDVDGARAAAEAVLAQEPGLDQVSSQLATILWRQGHLDDALGRLDALDAKHPSSNARSAMAAIRMQMGELTDATQLYRDALTLDPYFSLAWSGLLRADYFAGDLASLDADLAAAGEKLPDLATVGAMRGVARLLHDDAAGAEPLLLASLAANPLEPIVNHALALINQRRGDLDAAETYANEELAIAPGSVPAMRTLVEIYASQQRYEEQLTQIEALAKLLPTEALTRQAMAQAQFNLHRYDDSLQSLAVCLELAPRSPGCLMLKANALKKLGRDDEAAAVYQEALKAGKAR